MSPSANSRVLVLGSGIQGTCAALALARTGWTVTMIDRSRERWVGASVRGEGKIHLGYVYGNDRSRATASLMLDGAMAFSDLLERWIPGALDWSAIRSSPFVYGVMPDSLVAADDLAAHYAWVDEQIAARVAAGGRYLGSAEIAPVRAVDHALYPGVSGVVDRLYATSEVAVDPVLLRGAALGALDYHEVEFVGEQTVRAVSRSESGFVVECTDPADQTREHRADAVVNCLWDGRLSIDATMGIAPARPWVFRLKYGLHGTMPDSAALPPSITFALGPYGDIVRRANGAVYASWYSACMAGWSEALTPPASWRSSMAGVDPDWVRDDIVHRASKGLAALVPAFAGFRPHTVAAGVIVAWGNTDIYEPDSELHRRWDIGVHDYDGYLSVDTGKLTTAPMFAQRVGELLSS